MLEINDMYHICVLGNAHLKNKIQEFNKWAQLASKAKVKASTASTSKNLTHKYMYHT